jgi:hypothetical protein
VPWHDCLAIGNLLGTRMALNEVIAYIALGAQKATLAPRSFTIATFALVRIRQLGSIGMQIGGIGALVPERRNDLAKLGVRAMLAGTMANLMALKGITNALELPGSEEGMANATILISHYRGDELGFRIFAQDPSNAFPPDEFIPLEGTLAGQVSQRPAEGDCSSLHAYVPWTRYSSGISFKYEKMSGGKDREILQGESGVYKKLSEQSQLSMGCLLCTGIDLDPELTEKLAIMYGINDPTFVLCFSNRRANSLGESSRHAIVVASKLLPRIFEAL